MTLGEGDLFNAQRKPPEWDNLLGSVEAAIDPQEPVERQYMAATVAIEAVMELDTEQEKTSRFYAAGLYICDFARALYSPDGASSFTTQWLNEVVDKRDQSTTALPSGSGLLYYEVGATPLSDDRPYIETQPRPHSLHILTNALDQLYDYHGNERPVGSYIKKVLTADPGRNAQAGVFDGVGVGLSVILRQKYNLQNRHERNAFVPPGTLLKDIITPDDLEKIELEKLNTILAGMRLGDMFGYVRQIVQVQPDGAIEIDQTHVPKKAELQVNPAFVGQNLVRCPALYVQGLIPFISRLTPKVVATAQRQLLEQS